MDTFYAAADALVQATNPCWAFSLLLASAAVFPGLVLVPLFTSADVTNAWPQRRHLPPSKTAPWTLLRTGLVEMVIGQLLTPLTFAFYYVVHCWVIEGFSAWSHSADGVAVFGSSAPLGGSNISSSDFDAKTNITSSNVSSLMGIGSIDGQDAGASFGAMTAHRLLSQSAAPTFSMCVFQVALCMVFKQTVFYFAHRLMHEVKSLFFLHRKHHDYIITSGVAGHWFGLGEIVVSLFLPHFPLAWALDLHIVPAMVFFFLAEIDAVVVHSGYDVPTWLWPFCDARMHTFHHTHGQGAFGTTFFWDWVCGTDRHYKRHLARIKAQSEEGFSGENASKRDASMPR